MIDWLLQQTGDDPQVALGVPPEGLLSAPETAVFNELHIAKRRKDWLLGRWTSKKLLQAAEEKAGNKSPSCREISILAAQDGAPEVWLGEAGSMEREGRTLSISHSNGVAFCATAPGKHLLGADIEAVASRSLRFVEDYFTVQEKELVEQTPSENRDILITAIWSGKESALKAVRQGLHLDTRSVSCNFPSAQHLWNVEKEQLDWNPFSLCWSGSQEENGHPQLFGWWRFWQNFVLTLAVSADPQLAPERPGTLNRCISG